LNLRYDSDTIDLEGVGRGGERRQASRHYRPEERGIRQVTQVFYLTYTMQRPVVGICASGKGNGKTEQKVSSSRKTFFIENLPKVSMHR
jgi:hypothetical protein